MNSEWGSFILKQSIVFYGNPKRYENEAKKKKIPYYTNIEHNAEKVNRSRMINPKQTITLMCHMKLICATFFEKLLLKDICDSHSQ